MTLFLLKSRFLLSKSMLHRRIIHSYSSIGCSIFETSTVFGSRTVSCNNDPLQQQQQQQTSLERYRSIRMFCSNVAWTDTRQFSGTPWDISSASCKSNNKFLDKKRTTINTGIDSPSTNEAVAMSVRQQLHKYPNYPLKYLQRQTRQLHILQEGKVGIMSDATSKRSRVQFSTQSTRAASMNYVLYMWGMDTKGCLLQPTDASVDVKKGVDIPARIRPVAGSPIGEGGSDPILSDKSIQSIQSVVCGPAETAILTSDGRCYVCGENKSGQLGVGHTNPVLTLTDITDRIPYEDSGKGAGIRQVALGSQFAAFVDNVGDLYTAGYGGSPLMGTGYLGHGLVSIGMSCLQPKLVDSLVEDGCFVSKVVVGEAHMTVLTTEGEVLTTGAASYGRQGNFAQNDQLYLSPTEILTQESKVVDICGGKSFTLALTADGNLYGWGRNHKGQLGTGQGLSVEMYAMQPIPEQIESDHLLNQVVKVSAGQSHAACITASGKLFHWGMALHLEPSLVDETLQSKFVDVACGLDYTLAIDEQGRVFSFGVAKNKSVLGHGSSNKHTMQPKFINALTPNVYVHAISAGYKHAACLATET